MIYDQPKNKGQENVILRAKQILSYTWVPCWEMGQNDRKFYYPMKNGVENNKICEGIPYSSSRVENKFVGDDISFDTYTSATANPISDFYTRNLSDFDDKAFNCTIDNVFTLYGLVCNTFIGYALDLPLHRSTCEIGTSPEFYEILPRNAGALELCDVLVTVRPDGSTGGHIIMVTGIGRDEKGEVVEVEISEGMMPVARSKWYTKEEIEENNLGIDDKTQLSKYKIFRYKYLDKVGEKIECTLGKNEDIMLNMGELANYCEGEKIEFNIGYDADTLMITDGNINHEINKCDFVIKEFFGKAFTTYSTDTLDCGSYTAYLEKDGKKSASVKFMVVKTPEVTITKKDGTPFEKVKYTPVDPDGNPLTKDSPCLYAEDGSLSKGKVTIALFDGESLIPANIAVREREGKLVARTAANFITEDGNTTDFFVIGEDAGFYAYSAKVGTDVTISFSGQKMIKPHYISWKEEGVISFSQRLITDEELKAGRLESTITMHDNNFAGLEIFCKNEYGNISSKQINFVVK